MITKGALPTVRTLLPLAKRAVGGVVRSIMGEQPAVSVAGSRAFVPAQRAAVSELCRPLNQLFDEGELMAEQAEVEFFGPNEFQAELAGHEAAHDAALTEVLAAEATHTASESEAGALLGAALPITIRAMGASRTARPVYPVLARVNSRLVRGIRRSSPASGQLLRLVPCIQRRAVASLLAAHRSGRPITPQLVVRVLAGQTARVMSNPQTCRLALLRNTAIRKSTVARVGRPVRRHAAGFQGSGSESRIMTRQQEAIFEAPAAHEASYYGTSPEAGFEWETHEASYYRNPEWEDPEGYPEWEDPEAAWEDPEGYPEWEDPEAAWEDPEGYPEWEDPEAAWEDPEGYPEWEDPEAAWEDPEGYPEWEQPEWEQPYGSTEWEEEQSPEADLFFRRRLKRLAGLAKRLAPVAAQALGAMAPGAGPLVGLASSLVREGEAAVSALEAQLFGVNELHPEVGQTEIAHEAALTELMAHEAMAAQTEGEAAAALTGALPFTVAITGGRRALRRVMPTLAQANSRLVRTLRRQGPAGRALFPTVLAIQRLTVAGLRAAARRGQPITGPLVAQIMAAAVRRVLGSPRKVQRALIRNRMLRRRVAPPRPARARVSMPGGLPYHPRRVSGYPSMRPVRRRRMPA